MKKIPHTTPVRGAQSLGRATALLRLLAAHHATGLSLADVMHHSELDRTTAWRLLRALEEAGLVQREAQRPVYRLGIEAMALGLAAMRRDPLVELCRPVMKVLARRAQESVFLVVRSGDYSHSLHLEEGPRPVKNFAEHVGVTRLLGLGLPSFALLAALPDDELQVHCARYQADYLAHRLTASKLLRWVRQTRELGYAYIAAQGLVGVGVRFAVGSCGDAALGLVAPASRIPRARAPALATLVREELQRITSQVSGNPLEAGA